MLDQALRARVLVVDRAARPVDRRRSSTQSIRGSASAALRAGARSGARREAVPRLARDRVPRSRCSRCRPSATRPTASPTGRRATPTTACPSLLLADRARQRNNTASMVAFLEEAATRPRFDDYTEPRRAASCGIRCAHSPGSVDPAARAEAAAALRRRRTRRRFRRSCRRCAAMPRSVADNIRAACANAGDARSAARVDVVVAHRGREARGTRAGAERRSSSSSDVQRRAYECARGRQSDRAGDSSRPTRPCGRKAVAQWEARLAREARAAKSRAAAAASA